MSKSKRISARLNLSTAEKLQRLIKTTNSNLSQVIADAIEVYFTEKIPQQPESWKILKSSGFIGCGEGPADLSQNYKRYLAESLDKKYDNR